MASGVNVKMGVTGISQFSRDINTAKSSLKTLDAQLELNEKQFKATGDQETYMREKSELLTKKLTEQKNIASQAENALKQMTSNGVDKSSKAYQTMQQQMLNAKSAMYDIEEQMTQVGATGRDASKNVDLVSDSLKKIGDGVSYQNVLDGIGSITGAMEDAISKAWDMGKALVNATLGAGAWADELATTATVYGMSPEDLQRMRKTAQLIDTDADTIIKAQKKLKLAMGSEDNKNKMGAFAALGIDPTDRHDDWESVFWEAGEALMGMSDEVAKEEYAMQLFGKSWAELIPLFSAGREEYDKTFNSWSVVTGDQLDSLTKMDDQYQKMQGEWETFKMELLSTFSGPLEEGMATITGLFQELNTYLQTPEGQAALKQMSDSISSLIVDLTRIDPAEVVGGLQSVISGITDGLKWIQENSGTVVTALEAILGGWAALKVTGGVLKVLEVVDGLKWLTKNPNISIPGTDGGNAVTEAAKTATGAGAAGTAGTATGAGGAASWLDKAGPFIGWAGLAAIGVTAAYAIDKRVNHAEQVRGTDEYTAAKTQGYEGALYEYLLANQAWNDLLMNGGTDEEFQATQERIAAALEELNGSEGGAAALDAYGDWRQEHSYGNMDWVIPEDLQTAVDRMNQAAADLSGTSDGQKQSNSEMTQAANTMSGLPGQMESAVLNGLSGVRIYIDGQAAGEILSPYVSGYLGNSLRTIVK